MYYHARISSHLHSIIQARKLIENLHEFDENLKHSRQAGDASAAEQKAATQLTGTVMPIKPAKAAVEMVAVTAEMKKFHAVGKLRVEAMNARREGMRKKRAAEAAKEEKDKA